MIEEELNDIVGLAGVNRIKKKTFPQRDDNSDGVY